MRQAVADYRKYLLTSDLAPSTKKEYEKLCYHILNIVSDTHSISKIITRTIEGCSPSKARKICIVLQNSYARRYGNCQDIVIPTIHNAKKRPILTWTPEEYKYFVESATPTASRIAQFAYLTGQRVSDLVNIPTPPKKEHDLIMISLIQQKTGTSCYIPVTKDLKELLQSCKYEYVIHTIMGTKLTATAAAYQIKSDVKNLDMRKRLSIHGLRKLRAASMAEQGCTVYEIAAVTGHLNVNNLSIYTSQYNRRASAHIALQKIKY